MNIEQMRATYHGFATLVAENHPKIHNLIDKEFEACFLASTLGCNVSRDTLPFCGKVLKITQLITEKDNLELHDMWSRILQYFEEHGLPVERNGLPDIKLTFPLSRALLNGENISHKHISLIDPTDEETICRIAKRALKLLDKACGFHIFSKDSLRMILKRENTVCTYASTIDGRITAVMCGVKLHVQQTPCFYVLFVARDPEYCGNNMYHKFKEVLMPLLKHGEYKCDFVYWKQGVHNSINKAIEKSELEVFRSEAEAYPFEDAEKCIARIIPTIIPAILEEDKIPPDFSSVKSALTNFCIESCDWFTCAQDLLSLILKTDMLWKIKYTKKFSKLENYATTLQPVIK